MTRLGTILAAVLLSIAAAPSDVDRDGLDDALEARLLAQFQPRFWIDVRECAGRPASFEGDESTLRLVSRDGTLYGRASRNRGGIEGAVELQYFHLWAEDCGPISPHPLDAEHVTALVVPAETGYEARYWYAAAHQDTVCDTGNAATAAALDATTRGPDVWISAGKHASYLHPGLCNQRGCGVDQCGAMERLAPFALVNLGEAGAPMSGAAWIAAGDWDLDDKMTTDFDPELLAALAAVDGGGATRVSGRWRPTQFSLSVGADALGALGQVQKHGGGSLEAAEEHTGNALGKAFRAIGSALGHAAGALGLR